MDEAERLKPTDPRIKQMRAQNEVRDEFSVPADSSNPAGFDLVQVKNAGHDALEQGAWEKAKKRYQQLDTLGYNPTYAKLNLAMAAIGADAYKVAREHLSAFTPYANSATGLHVTALRMICNIAERGNGKEFARQLEELKEQKRRYEETNEAPYDYTLSPLQHLETGLAKSNQNLAGKVTSVFAVLKEQETVKAQEKEQD